MAAETRILVFASQALALTAAQQITNNAGIGTQAGTSTMIWSTPQLLTADPAGRWFVRHPTDEAWLANVSGYTVASSVGLAAVNESGLTPTLIPAGVWRDRFSDATKAKITLAASDAMVANPPNPTLQIMLDDVAAHGMVDLTSPKVQAGMKLLITSNLVTANEAAAVMVPVGLTA